MQQVAAGAHVQSGAAGAAFALHQSSTPTLNRFLHLLGQALARYLSQPHGCNQTGMPADRAALACRLQTGDVLLVQGNKRLSTATNYLTTVHLGARGAVYRAAAGRTRHFDLSVLLLMHWPWRQRDPTRAICSTLIAGAFQEVGYPLLPAINSDIYEDSERHRAVKQSIFPIRNRRLFPQRDFGFSPWFEFVKPTLVPDLDFHRIH